MKKILKILLYIVLVLLVIIIVAPFLFKGKIMDIAKEQINNNVNAKVEFTDLSLSLIKDFPNFSITLKGLTVSGIEHFEKDTLLKLGAFHVSVDLISAIRMENIKVKRISVIDPTIKARINYLGQANWDIAKEAAEQEVEEEKDTSTAAFDTKIALKKFEIQNANISYDDDSTNMHASLKDFDFELKGDLAQDVTVIDLNSSIAAIVMEMGDIKYLNRTSFAMQIAVDANLKNNIYILKENQISVNDIVLGFSGSVEIPDSTTTKMDMKFATKKTSFKSLLSLVPAIYMSDFESIETDGNLTLQGIITGNLTENTTPSAAVRLIVEDARFKYPDLPKEASDIAINLEAKYNGMDNDKTTVNLSKFHMNLGGNPIDATVEVKTPVSDMFVKGAVNTALDLSTLTDVVPMENTTIQGKINSDLSFEGYMSYIENETYDKFTAKGNLSILDFLFSSPDAPTDVHIIKSSLTFSPQYVAVNAFDAQMGASDFHLNGRLENFFPYLFSDGIIKGDFSFSSTLLDANEFITESDDTEVAEEVEDSVPMSVIEVPRNIDFKLSSNLKKIYYDKLEIDNLLGLIHIQEGIVDLQNLSMNTLQGSVKLSGIYSTIDIENPTTNLSIKATRIDIPAAVKSISSLEKMVPIAKKASGKVSLDLTFSSLLDNEMSPVLESVQGQGELSSNEIGLSGSNTFNKINEVMKVTKNKDLTLQDVDILFTINDGRIYVKPFDTKMGNTKVNIGGDQGLDQTMNYTIKMDFPRTGLAKTATDGIYSLASQYGVSLGQSDRIKMDFLVSGTFTDPKVKPIVLGGSEEKSVATQVKEKAVETVKKEVEEKKKEVKKAAKAEADKIIADAEREAAKIKAEAKKLADLTREEADRNADKLLREAKNPIAKKAAEPLARKVRQEGEDKAQKIEDEANKKADALVNKARQEANKLLE